jgi:hypothetical protein
MVDLFANEKPDYAPMKAVFRNMPAPKQRKTDKSVIENAFSEIFAKESEADQLIIIAKTVELISHCPKQPIFSLTSDEFGRYFAWFEKEQTEHTCSWCSCWC